MNNVPAKLLTRNEHGLLNIDHIFNEDNTVNWRKMVPIEFLYLNGDLKKRKKLEVKYGKEYSQINILDDKVSDEDLILTLRGYRHIAKIRGYNKVDYIIRQSNDAYVSVTCQIEFLGNFESEGRIINFAENGSATLESTHGFGRKYLLECATNRSFCRSVGNFLNINIQTFETGDITEESFESGENPNTPPPVYEMLEKALKAKNKTLDTLIDRLKKEEFPGWEKITTLEQIPAEKAFYFLGLLKTKES